jgi:hypothetical protein
MVKYTNKNLSKIIDKFTTYLAGFAGALAVLFIIYGGFLMVTAGGNKDRLDSAKKTLTFAILGLIIIVLSKVFLSILFRIPSMANITN